MKKLTYSSVILGLVFVFSSCGTEPTDSGTSASDLSWKTSGNSKHINYKRMSESFEAYADESTMPDKYKWLSGGKALGKVTKATARQTKKQSLEIEIPEDPTGASYMGSQYCLNESVDTYVHAKFSIKFGNFVSWTGFGISDSTRFQYYWWTRADGTVFDETTFDSFAANAWQDVDIVIDRDQNLATLTINGRAHYAELDQVWPATGSTEPMKCLFVLAATMGNAQKLFVDDIVINGH